VSCCACVPLTTDAPAVPNGGRTLRGLVRYFFGLGSWGFGGPIALAGYMHRDLVADRRWYTDDEYQQGLAISQAMPGPLAAQLAMWLGYLERRWFGALAVALPFVVPPFLLVTAVAVVYTRYQGLSVVQDVFFGVAPAVLAIIAIASYKLARSTNKRDPVLWGIAMGLITPGPVVIMATFAGYLVHGIVGAIVATAAVFLPVYLFAVVPARRTRAP
jgi:chromate transporter